MLLKIFNHNAVGGVIGVFNARHNPAQPPVAIAGALRPSDVEELAGDRFAVWAHNAQTLTVQRHHDALPLSLKPLEFEVFTIVPIMAGLAPIGLADMFNSGGAVLSHTTDPATHTLAIRTGGDGSRTAPRFLAWSEKKPKRVVVEGKPTAFTFDKPTGALELKLPPTRDVCHVTIMY